MSDAYEPKPNAIRKHAMKLNLYTLANLFTLLSERTKALLFRLPYNPVNADARAYVYSRAQAVYDYLNPKDDLINRAPPKSGEPLMYVKPEDHEELRRLGAVDKEGKWYMPKGISDEQRWVFVRWFARATPDLITHSTSTALTTDGRSVNGYVEADDKQRGGDSSATGIVMGVLAVLPAFMFALCQFPIVGPWISLAVGVPLLLLHAYVLFRSEDALTLFKVLLLSIGLPLAGGALSGSHESLEKSELSIGVSALAFSGLMVVAFLLSFFGNKANSGKIGTPLVSAFSRFMGAMGVIVVLFVLNAALSFLPPSLHALKMLTVFVVSCSYTYVYVRGNELHRTGTLLSQSLYLAGPTHNDGSAVGKLAPARQEQIREAARDTSSLIPICRAQGVMAKSDLPSAPDADQGMALSLWDLSTHMMVWGKSGTGKTTSILRPTALRLKLLPERVGAILSDGKGAMVADMRSLLDIVIEPGTKFAPFQGMDPDTVAEAFNEATDDGIKSEAIWSDGADNFHLFALTVLKALVDHEKEQKADAEKLLASFEHQIEYLLATKEIGKRRGQDTSYLTNLIDQVRVSIETTNEFLVTTRQYTWTPAAYSRVANILATPVMARGGMWRASDEALKLFDFLGFPSLPMPGQEVDDPAYVALKNAYALRALHRPITIHPGVHVPGLVLGRGHDYFNFTWPNTDEKQRSSFLINVNRDILSFLKSDKLRGGMIDGVDHGDTAWADTEEGVDVLAVLTGSWLGINLPTTQFKKSGKLIAKLVKSKIFKAIKIRSEKGGTTGWRIDPTQCAVMDMVDECHFMVSPLEADMTSIARSMGLFFIYATQKIEGVIKVMKSEEAATNFLEDFGSHIAYRTSAATYKYLQGRVGEAKKLMIPSTTQAVMDLDRAYRTYENTIFHDPNHPGADTLRDLDRRGGGRFQVVVPGITPYRGLSRRVPLEEQRDQSYIPVHMGGKLEVGPILEMWELTDKLSVRGSVIALLNRAGHDRIDFAKTYPMSVQDVEDALAAHRAKSQQAA